MSNFRERLEQEKKELDERIGKLDVFIGSEKFDDIEPMQMSLLIIQIQAMQTYGQCLLERITWLQLMDEQNEQETAGKEN